MPGVPGILSNSHNRYVQMLKEHPWSALPALLGSGAERILTDMLLDCGIFESVGSSSNMSQLSGVPMSDLKVLSAAADTLETTTGPADGQKAVRQQSSKKRGLAEIRFVRHRMLYARPSLNARGKVAFGIGQVHVLNRYNDLDSKDETVHVAKYLFPNQFGLHNVLNSDVDRKDTSQPFQDYTLREKEIARAELRRKRQLSADGESDRRLKPWVPKRLRSEALELILSLRKRHCKCPYAALLQYYCPPATKEAHDQSASIGMATSAARVSAFCRAVIFRVIPKAFLGGGAIGNRNKSNLSNAVDVFVRLRRYESMSLHDILQGIRLDSVSWVAPPKCGASKLSNTDFEKRKELMAELLYWLFDSYLVPLLRSHFHITESSLHRNQLFYFRHDVWRAMSEPAFAMLKTTMLEPIDPVKVSTLMSRRSLGVSKVRLLPKAQGMRPIINLRRRIQRQQGGALVLGKSINSILTPAFSILNCEKSSRPEMLGSALFSVSDMHGKLQAYRQSLIEQGLDGASLYFAKVDVQACFDTIPQKRLMQLVRSIIAAEEYRVAKYSRAKLLGGQNEEMPGFGAKPSWKYLTKATAGGQAFDFEHEVSSDSNNGRNRSVYVDGVVQKPEGRRTIIELLEEHVESNIIRLGNRFYRQKEGIPQGSIVSSLLCSYFYAELERQSLGFLGCGQTLLLRLIDDFLVISTSRDIAERFMHIMHRGVPEYGVQVKAAKSRANFDVEINGMAITRLPSQTDFPYCGNAINTVTLDISKDHERRRASNIQDSMTVEYSKLPGQTFYRKALNALKLQMHAMLLSTKYNNTQTVLSNLYHAFIEVAQKCYHYATSLPVAKQPGGKLMISKSSQSLIHQRSKVRSYVVRLRLLFPCYQFGCDPALIP